MEKEDAIDYKWEYEKESKNIITRRFIWFIDNSRLMKRQKKNNTIMVFVICIQYWRKYISWFVTINTSCLPDGIAVMISWSDEDMEERRFVVIIILSGKSSNKERSIVFRRSSYKANKLYKSIHKPNTSYNTELKNIII